MAAKLSAFLAVAVLLSAVPLASAVSWEWAAVNTKVMDRSAAEAAAGADASKATTYSSNMAAESSAASASASPASSEPATEGTASGSTDATAADAPALSDSNGARVAPWGNGLGASGTSNALFLDELELSLEWIIILILIGVMVVIFIGLFVFCCMFGGKDADKVLDMETAEVKLPQPKGAAKASASTASASKKLNDLITTTVSSKDMPSKKL